MTASSESTIIHWFRRDLRLEDNHALHQAIASGQRVQCIFILDSNILEKLPDPCDVRLTFIHATLEKLNLALQQMGGTLLTYYGKPTEVWKDIIRDLKPTQVYTNRDYEPYAQERDKGIYALLQSHGITMSGYKDHVIFEKSEVVKDDLKPYTVFTPYSKKWKSKVTADTFSAFDCGGLSNVVRKCSPQAIIPLESMHMQRASLEHIPSMQLDESIISHYHQTRDTPSVRGTSRLSVHLRFGTVSIRQLARIGMLKNEKWLNELIWRDFYQAIIYHFPHSVTVSFKPAYDRIEWRNDEQEFQAWCKGQTGYPIVDAGMRELNTTGFMHNRVRMIVASFLTKHLLIDWRWGERYFAAKLNDFELASNVGGWQWAASSGCDAAPYFRVFNPELQTGKFDPQYKYIKQWVPELGTPAYCKPIVEHKAARDRVLTVFKTALQDRDA
jgi:deoxyribodipyrimidine photo-lyase